MNSQRSIIKTARAGRPDIAAVNAGLLGRPRLAAYVAKFPHSSGVFFSTRQLVESAIRAQRCLLKGKDIFGNPI